MASSFWKLVRAYSVDDSGRLIKDVGAMVRQPLLARGDADLPALLPCLQFKMSIRGRWSRKSE